MGLFKRFTENKKATKEELTGFKYRLKYGDDPAEHWRLQAEHWEKYKHHKEAALELLGKIYRVKNTSTYQNYCELRVWHWSRDECSESPIKEHVYIHNYGAKNPKKDEDPECLACGKTLTI